ncbi:prolyl oligopeptidase family serine peptidase [Kribbella sp. GL6]|uniref:prolyl oligopeptidase family serine peptidase n=1 Tax=Kribbella sp. GL6 TaxID=3419765 RepID=UPI003D02D250
MPTQLTDICYATQDDIDRPPSSRRRRPRRPLFTALVGGDVTTHRGQLRAVGPIAHVAADAPPFLIVHGTADETVPYAHAERLHRALVDVGASSRCCRSSAVSPDLRNVLGAGRTFVSAERSYRRIR